MNRDVYVIGVGMHRFSKDHIPKRDLYFTAGMDALGDAGHQISRCRRAV